MNHAPPRTINLGILQTDSVMQEFEPEHGTYPAMFERRLSGTSELVEFQSFVVHEGELPEDVRACDAYLITGSRKSVYDDEPWIHELAGFVGSALDAGQKVVGICFGHQLIAHFFGGETRGAEQGWGVGVHTAQIDAVEPWMEPTLDEIALLHSHKDQVIEMPEGARCFASSDFCRYAGFVWKEQVLTFQGHPEFTKAYSRALMEMRSDMLGPEVFESGMASLADETHEQTVARWILNFLRA